MDGNFIRFKKEYFDCRNVSNFGFDAINANGRTK